MNADQKPTAWYADLDSDAKDSASSADGLVFAMDKLEQQRNRYGVRDSNHVLGMPSIRTDIVDCC